MSATECGYLQSAKISAVVTVILGGMTSNTYFYPPYSLVTYSMSLPLGGTFGQLVFGCLTVAFYCYFRSDYFVDDGINTEYPNEASGNIDISYCFYLWCIACGFLFMIVCSGGYLLYKKRQMNKQMESIEFHAYNIVNNQPIE